MSQEKLDLWKKRLGAAESAYQAESAHFDERERMYRGRRDTRGLTRDDTDGETTHVRNISMELIEAQVDSSIPQPKVTARREEDQPLAKNIEDMLRNEIDRLPMEEINDMMARTVPIQGGGAYLIEWDNTLRTHYSVGELWISAIHPKQLVPQPGIYSSIEDMDWIILKLPQTKEYIRRKFGVDVDEEGESEPEAKGTGADTAEDLVTEYCAYYRNDDGGIGKYSWVNDVELEDIEDYQARRLDRCEECGSTDIAFEDGKKTCQDCGSHKIKSEAEEYEEIWQPITRQFGKPPIPGAEPAPAPMGSALLGALAGGMFPTVDNGAVDGMIPTRIPYYKPDLFPVILQRNVSVYGQLLGASDLDAIADQQNTTNRIEQQIIDKLVQAGGYMILPDEVSVPVNTEQGKVIRVSNPADAAMIQIKDLEGNIAQDISYLSQIYEEARQVIGITDSFQGRKDTTATSGTAKQFAAAQTAGRLESKRTQRDAAYAALYECMFKFRLAYTDEPVPIRTEDPDGNIQYETFNRYDFLEQDADGEWYWNDAFLFSVDQSSPLAQNRDAMWQETRLNFTSGAFGDPASIETQILFWRKMEILHYPDAGDTRRHLERQLARQQQMQAQMMAQQQAMALQAQAQARQDAARNAFQQRRDNQAALDAIDRQARQNAARDAMNQARQQTGRQSGR